MTKEFMTIGVVMIASLIFYCVFYLLDRFVFKAEKRMSYEEAINAFKSGDKVKILKIDPFYSNYLNKVGKVISRSFSDGYDCTVFDGFDIKMKDGKVFTLQPDDLEKV